MLNPHHYKIRASEVYGLLRQHNDSLLAGKALQDPSNAAFEEFLMSEDQYDRRAENAYVEYPGESQMLPSRTYQIRAFNCKRKGEEYEMIQFGERKPLLGNSRRQTY